MSATSLFGSSYTPAPYNFINGSIGHVDTTILTIPETIGSNEIFPLFAKVYPAGVYNFCSNVFFSCNVSTIITDWNIRTNEPNLLFIGSDGTVFQAFAQVLSGIFVSDGVVPLVINVLAITANASPITIEPTSFLKIVKVA